MKALVTGGRSGIGAAIVAALEATDAEVEVVDIDDGGDDADPETCPSSRVIAYRASKAEP